MHEINEELLELPEVLVEQLICKQLLNPLYIEHSIFVQQHFNKAWFKNDNYKLIYTLLSNYWIKYNSEPTKEILLHILSNDKFKEQKGKLVGHINTLYDIDESKYDKKFLQDTLINYTKRKSDVFCYIR